MAENDEVCVLKKDLRQALVQYYPSSQSLPTDLVSFWIDEAVRRGLVSRFTRPEFKQVRFCLCSNIAAANGPLPPELKDTSREEAYVVNLLCKHGGWMSRVDVMNSLVCHHVWRCHGFALQTKAGTQ
ncbi:hypothetical protein ACA910_001850 [Epithemia clementina (nom. ined.)]